MKKIVRTALAHMVIVLAAVFVVFLVLHQFNPMMGFLTHKYSQILLLILCVSTIINSIIATDIYTKAKD